MTGPLVTVVTPLYNYEQYIAACIESVLGQTYPHIEMLVVDDGSSDQGPAIVESYARHGVRLLRQTRNGYGVARALNKAIGEAQGEYISWLSADDYYLPEKIERNLAFFEERSRHNPRLGAIHSDVIVEIADRSCLDRCNLPPQEIERQLAATGRVRWKFGLPGHPPEDMLYYSLMWNQVNGCTAFIPKQVYQDVGLFQDTWAVTQDYEMWFRIMLGGYDIEFLPEALSVTRFHPVNVGNYSAVIPAEGGLVTRLASEAISWRDIEPSLVKQGFATPQRDFHVALVNIFMMHKLYDYALLNLEQYLAAGGPRTPQLEAALEQLASQFPEPGPALAPPTTLPTFLLALSPGGKTGRFHAVISNYMQAFNSEDPVRLLIWLSPESRREMQAFCDSKFEEIASFLQRPTHTWPAIEYLPDISSKDALKQAHALLPIGNTDPVEQEFLYLARRVARLIQYVADASGLRRARQFIEHSSHFPIPQGYNPYLSMLNHRTLFFSLPQAAGERWVSFQDRWFRLSSQLPLPQEDALFTSIVQLEDVRPILELPPAELEMHWGLIFWAASDLETEYLRSRGLKAHKVAPWLDPVYFSASATKLDRTKACQFLALYQPGNSTGWQETVRAYLTAFQPADDVELVLYVPPTALSQEVDWESEIVETIESAGFDSDNIPELMVLNEALDSFEEMALFANTDALVCPFRQIHTLSPWLSRLRQSGTPLVTHAFDGDLSEKDHYLLQSFEQLVPSPLDPIATDIQSLAQLLQEIAHQPEDREARKRHLKEHRHQTSQPRDYQDWLRQQLVAFLAF